MQASNKASESCTDQEQSFAIVLWGWLRSHMPDYNGQKGELFAIEEVGKLLYGKQPAIMQSSIVLTQAQCRLALKHKVRTFRNDFLPIRIRTRIARSRDQRNPCGSRTIPQIRGLKKQC